MRHTNGQRGCRNRAVAPVRCFCLLDANAVRLIALRPLGACHRLVELTRGAPIIWARPVAFPAQTNGPPKGGQGRLGTAMSSLTKL
jgi:hypothetical protein